jgi:hypothetical protein
MQLTFLSEEPPASPSRSQDFAKGLLTLEATSCLHLVQWLKDTSRGGSSGKTSPESCHLTADGILAPSSGCWQNSGMGLPTAFLTLNTCEWTGLDGLSLNDDGVCSLSDVLQNGAVPQRFYLSPKACAGILRRAEKRGKTLPPQLQHALEAAAGSEQTSTATDD